MLISKIGLDDPNDWPEASSIFLNWAPGSCLGKTIQEAESVKRLLIITSETLSSNCFLIQSLLQLNLEEN